MSPVFKLFIVLMATLFIVLHSADIVAIVDIKSLGSDTISQITESDLNSNQNLFEKEIEQLQINLNNQNLSKSVKILQDIQLEIMAIQQRKIKTMFPVDFLLFKETLNTELNSEDFLDNDRLGSIFNQHYQNKSGDKIDINISMSDSIIQEYLSIINNPNISDGLINIDIIKVQTYKALYSINNNLDHSLYELNIVLNPNVLITLIYNGSQNETVLFDFLNEVSLLTIENYLKK